MGPSKPPMTTTNKSMNKTPVRSSNSSQPKQKYMSFIKKGELKNSESNAFQK